MPLRVVFMGTPDFAGASLQALLDSPHEVVAVVSQPDRRAGRGRKLHRPPVAALADTHGIPVNQPASVKTAGFRRWVRELAPDLGVVAAFGHILGPRLLATPRLGCINVHASLLPRWRGASPIQSAIQHGDPESGVTIMQMDAGMDTGDILMMRSLALSDDETAATLHDRLAALGGPALIDTLAQIEGGQATPRPQGDDGVTYAALLTKEDADIDWASSALDVTRKIRAHHPWPGSQTHHGGGLLRLHPPVEVADIPGSVAAPGTVVQADKHGVIVAAGDGQCVRLGRLQAPGRRALDAGSFLAGYELDTGMVLGTEASPEG